MDRRRCRRGVAASVPPSLALPLLLLLLVADSVRCPDPIVHLARHLLPPEYEANLQVLKLALALNEEWSPVWSEKLNAEAVAELHPDPEFCTRLTPTAVAGADKDGKEEKEKDEDDPPAGPPVDTYVTVRKIVEHCSFSGMYIDFGMKLIGASLQCLFNRFAQINLSAVILLVDNADEEFRQYLRGLVQDSQEIADKLAAVGESLRNLVQLVTFFDDVEKQSTQLAARPASKRAMSAFYVEAKDVAGKLSTRMDTEFEHVCAVDAVDWYDKETEETVSLEEFKYKNKKKGKDKKKKDKKDKKKKDKKEKDSKDDGKGDKKKDQKDEKDKGKEKKDKGKEEKKDKKDEKDKGKEKKDKGKEEKKEQTPIERANEIRMLMRKVFQGLLIREMPSKMWREIFSMNILMKPADIKKVAVNAPKKKATEDMSFDL